MTAAMINETGHGVYILDERDYPTENGVVKQYGISTGKYAQAGFITGWKNASEITKL